MSGLIINIFYSCYYSNEIIFCKLVKDKIWDGEWELNFIDEVYK